MKLCEVHQYKNCFTPTNLLISIDYFEKVAGIFTLEFLMRSPTQFSTFKQSHLGLPWGSDKVNSVQEACTKCFAVHILKFEILQITRNETKNIRL